MKAQQIRLRNENLPVPLPPVPVTATDSLGQLLDFFLEHMVATSEDTRKAQRRDISRLIQFIETVDHTGQPHRWTPRLSRAFLDFLREPGTGQRRLADRSINRIIAHLKSFSKWLHEMGAFHLGNPMEGVKNSFHTGLDIHRAVTPTEERRLLDAADMLPVIWGRSRDRSRDRRAPQRPLRKGARPYRDRAIIYTLLGTGMRRAEACGLLMDNIDFKRRSVTVRVKGDRQHTYMVSAQALAAISDYLEHERPGDAEKWGVPNLFLTAATRPRGGQLSAKTINKIWNRVCALAGVAGKTVHGARHHVGKKILKNTGSVRAVQEQLGHRSTATSYLYTRPTPEELLNALDSTG